MPDASSCAGGFDSFSRLLVGLGRPVAVEQGTKDPGRATLAVRDQGHRLWATYWNGEHVPHIDRARRIARAIYRAQVPWCSELLVLHVLGEYADVAGILSLFIASAESPDKLVADAVLLYELVDSAFWISRSTIADRSRYMVLLHGAKHLLMSASGARDIFQWMCWRYGVDADPAAIKLNAEIFLRREIAKSIWARLDAPQIHKRLGAATKRWFEGGRKKSDLRNNLQLEIAFAAGKSRSPIAAREVAFRNAIANWIVQTLKDCAHSPKLPPSLHGNPIDDWLSDPLPAQLDARVAKRLKIGVQLADGTLSEESPSLELEPEGGRGRRLPFPPVILPTAVDRAPVVIVGYIYSKRRLTVVSPSPWDRRRASGLLALLLRHSRGLKRFRKSYRALQIRGYSTVRRARKSTQ